MRIIRLEWVACAALALTMGCVEDSGSGGSGGEAGGGGGVIEDMGSDGAVLIDMEVTSPDDGVSPDGGVVEPDEGMLTPDEGMLTPDEGMLEPDMAAPETIETCEDACGKYAACDQLGDQFGDLDACLRDCGRIARNGRPDEWFDCVEAEVCNLLRLCPIPDIEPLECDEVCTLVDECGVELPIPDCAGLCAENAETFRPCGDALYGGVCDTGAFESCIVREVFPQCNALCASGVACNLVREPECIADCLGDQLSGDPLAALRSRQLAQCAQLAGEDCVRLDACFFPEGGPEAIDQNRFCARYQECGFGEFFPCGEMVRELQGQGSTLACGFEVMRDRCPEFEFEILELCFDGGVNPRAAPCNRLCEGKVVCGLLDEAERGECAGACIGDFGADPDGLERAAAELPCAEADRCPDLEACIEGAGPAAECAAFCGALDGCGLGGPDCLPECDAQWPRDRHAAYRACVAEAGDDCEAIAACTIAPGAPCEAYCARTVDECGVDQAAGCVGVCDDAHFADPEQALSRIACALTAPECFDDFGAGDGHTVARCVRDGGEGFGVECLGFCRAESECQGDPAGLAPCLAACGAGLVGADGLRFMAAEPCLAELDPAAECPELLACVPEDAGADCAALCDRADGCGLDLAECPARCAEDPLAGLRSLRGEACIRPEDDCEAVAACIIPPPFEPEAIVPVPGEGEFCAAWDACEAVAGIFGPCEFNYPEYAESPDVINCLFDLVGRCPAADIFGPFFECTDRQGPAGPHPLERQCERLCEARRQCDPDLPAQRDCEQACQNQLDPGDADSAVRLDPQMQCGSAWSCPDLDICLGAAEPAAICAAQCANAAACGLVGDAIDCAEACDQDFGRAREQARRACLAGVAADDCEGIAACGPPPPLPCGLACDALAACGLGGGPLCVPQCDDDSFADPATGAQRIACLVAAGDDCDAVAACQEDPGQGGGACFAYCRATTECDPDADEELPACLTRCLTGFGDEDALRFSASEACLEALPPGGECPALVECLPAGPPAVDCEAYCGDLEACRVPAEGCLAACEAEPPIGAAICVSDALRTGQRCGGVAACVEFAPPPPDAVCRGLCDIITGCDPAVDPFLCRLDCTPTPVAAPFQLACAEFAACGEELDACRALDETPAEACVELCAPAVVNACGLFPAVDACIATCTGRDASEATPENYLERAGQCFADAIDGDACDEAAAANCLSPASCDLRGDLIYFQGDQGVIDFDIVGLPDAYEGSCGASAGPEQIVVINVARRANLTAQIAAANYDTLLYLRSPCDGDEVICNDDAFEFDLPDGLWSAFRVEVEPGTYYLFIEGFSGDVGEGSVQIDIEPL